MLGFLGVKAEKVTPEPIPVPGLPSLDSTPAPGKDDLVAPLTITGTIKPTTTTTNKPLVQLHSGYIEGQDVRVNVEGKWETATIALAHGAGLYDVVLSTGQKVERVTAARLRAPTPPPPPQQKRANEQGDANGAVRALEQGSAASNGHHQPSQTQAVAQPQPQQVVQRTESKTTEGPLVEGACVEAKYHSGENYFPAKIIKVRGDGKYDLDYGSGEKEFNVPRSAIRFVEGPKHYQPRKISPRKMNSSSPTEETAAAARSAAAAEAQAHTTAAPSSMTQAPGVNQTSTHPLLSTTLPTSTALSRRGSNGGDPSRRGSGGNGQPPQDLREGSRIEARFRGQERWVPGHITRSRLDGCFDIQYDDGEKDFDVQRSMIRLISGQGSPPQQATQQQQDPHHNRQPQAQSINKEDDHHQHPSIELKEGIKVEARYMGRDKWVVGKITRVRSNGSFDVNYYGGEKELGVPSELVRAVYPQDQPAGIKREEEWHENMRVEARYKGRERYYPGHISRVRPDGTYDINYDDGEKETSVERRLIRRSDRGSPKRKSVAAEFVEGMRVDARYKGRTKWFSGKITRVRLNGTFDVLYDDGEKEMRVEPEFIRMTVESSEKHAPTAAVDGLKEGAKVEARYKGRSRYFPATIAKVLRDGTYDLRYDEDDVIENSVPADMIRLLDKPADSKEEKDFKEGDVVEAARTRNGALVWSKGKVKSVRIDASYDIDFDDGSEERRVERKYVRELAAESKGTQFNVGDKVEARFRGRSKYFSAVIRGLNKDGTYDVLYEDGDLETGVAADVIRHIHLHAKVVAEPKDTPTSNSAAATTINSTASPAELHGPGKLKVGDRAEARVSRRADWLRGKIARVLEDGFYEIDCDEGYVFQAEPDCVRPIYQGPANSGGDSDTVFKVGDKVESAPLRSAQYHKATVINAHDSYVCCLSYRDGTQERDVPIERIRHSSNKSQEDQSHSHERRHSSSSAKRCPYQVDEEVEARQGDDQRWRLAVVVKCEKLAAYDVVYDDVNQPTDKMIRPYRMYHSCTPTHQQVSFSEGDKVDCINREHATWMKAKVLRVNNNGTVDLEYVDGKREKNVPNELVRHVNAITSAQEHSDKGQSRGFNSGDVVEINYKQRGHWFRATIKQNCHDNTYNVQYEDGEHEQKVPAELIRHVEEDIHSGPEKQTQNAQLNANSKPGQVFEVGQTVEAQWMGGTTWFGAKITGYNAANGTYGVLYDDGLKNSAADASWIRVPENSVTVTQPQMLPSLPPPHHQQQQDPLLSMPLFDVGNRIEARFRGGQKYFPGTVSVVNPDNSFGIKYDDGDLEAKVSADMIRLLGCVSSAATPRQPQLSARRVFDVDDNVEARFRGGEKWFRAVVTGLHADGTYDLKYDDGDTESSVESERIRYRESTSDPNVPPVPATAVHTHSSFNVGDAVEARFKCGIKWFSGKVSAVKSNETFDIRYDDGDIESEVKLEMIRRPGTGISGKPLVEVGSQVEVRYAHERDWNPGVIRRINADGTVAVEYEDKRIDRKVQREAFRLRQFIHVDDEVEVTADLGNGLFASLRGKVIRRAESAYDVAFHNGLRREGVPASEVRLARLHIEVLSEEPEKPEDPRALAQQKITRTETDLAKAVLARDEAVTAYEEAVEVARVHCDPLYSQVRVALHSDPQRFLGDDTMAGMRTVAVLRQAVIQADAAIAVRARELEDARRYLAEMETTPADLRRRCEHLGGQISQLEAALRDVYARLDAPRHPVEELKRCGNGMTTTEMRAMGYSAMQVVLARLGDKSSFESLISAHFPFDEALAAAKPSATEVIRLFHAGVITSGDKLRMAGVTGDDLLNAGLTPARVVEEFGYAVGDFTLPVGTRLLCTDVEFNGSSGITILAGGPAAYDVTYYQNGAKNTREVSVKEYKGWSVMS